MMHTFRGVRSQGCKAWLPSSLPLWPEANSLTTLNVPQFPHQWNMDSHRRYVSKVPSGGKRRKESFYESTGCTWFQCLAVMTISLSNSNNCMVRLWESCLHPSMVIQPVGRALTWLWPLFSSSSSQWIILLLFSLNLVFFCLAHLLYSPGGIAPRGSFQQIA